QGSQFTSCNFSLFCKKNGIVQSMSRKGNPWDNAPMERYFNTLKQELIYLKNYKSKMDLYTDIEDFSYVWYNRKRPHTFNGFITPYQARFNFFGS
ncbi:integrase core domain-containing protein, partial [Sebaldella sp. S0638]|uniref:integrase core domain-containing protein n=1 Tax=Sebaldella sp. S0638 TaxID=2957809 RepID=UPI00209C7B02